MAAGSHLESFYVTPENVYGNTLLITGDEFAHLTKVLRKRVGDQISVVDGCGNRYDVSIVSLTRDSAKAEILRRRRLVGEPLVEVTLAAAVIKGPRFDWLVEKATEIGVRCILPVISQRCVVVPGELKKNRWQRIAIAAMKQCGRTILPKILKTMSVEEVVKHFSNVPIKLVTEAGSKGSIRQIAFSYHDKRGDFPRKVLILVGPEGGFTSEEITIAQEHGFECVSLGQRRLRSETAAILGATLLLWELEEL